jgi:hypothetical protein
MKKKVNESTQTLVGIIIPYAWNESDQITDVSLSATDDEEYLIENSARFLDLVHKTIRAVGLVRKGKKIKRTINIKKFDMLDSTVDEPESRW